MAISNLNSLLSDIYVRYVQIQDEDFRKHYRVFDTVFQGLHQKMKEVDPYYNKYSSTVQFGGSHYDNVRIVKPDEFDINIVIGLPVSTNIHPNNPANTDIMIEPKSAGFVQLRMGAQFQALPNNVKEWTNNKAAFGWMDGEKYLLRSKFMDWFKSVVNRALNTYTRDSRTSLPICCVGSDRYTISKSESGPAMTLIIENKSTGFRLDVDLVPALKFPESRWPVGPAYRRTPDGYRSNDWMLVAKSIKNGNRHDEARSWRIARPNQERALINNSGNLRQTWRLIKKLRDALDMHKIASYFIKNIFLWEIDEKMKTDPLFWSRSDQAMLFKHMVGKLYDAMNEKRIPYFWNKNENLLKRVDKSTKVEYASKLRPLVRVLENPQEFRQVAKYLLSPEEFMEYNVRFLHI